MPIEIKLSRQREFSQTPSSGRVRTDTQGLDSGLVREFRSAAEDIAGKADAYRKKRLKRVESEAKEILLDKRSELLIGNPSKEMMGFAAREKVSQLEATKNDSAVKIRGLAHESQKALRGAKGRDAMKSLPAIQREFRAKYDAIMGELNDEEKEYVGSSLTDTLRRFQDETSSYVRQENERFAKQSYDANMDSNITEAGINPNTLEEIDGKAVKKWQKVSSDIVRNIAMRGESMGWSKDMIDAEVDRQQTRLTESVFYGMLNSNKVDDAKVFLNERKSDTEPKVFRRLAQQLKERAGKVYGFKKADEIYNAHSSDKARLEALTKIKDPQRREAVTRALKDKIDSFNKADKSDSNDRLKFGLQLRDELLQLENSNLPDVERANGIARIRKMVDDITRTLEPKDRKWFEDYVFGKGEKATQANSDRNFYDLQEMSFSDPQKFLGQDIGALVSKGLLTRTDANKLLKSQQELAADPNRYKANGDYVKNLLPDVKTWQLPFLANYVEIQRRITGKVPSRQEIKEVRESIEDPWGPRAGFALDPNEIREAELNEIPRSVQETAARLIMQRSRRKATNAEILKTSKRLLFLMTGAKDWERFLGR